MIKRLFLIIIFTIFSLKAFALENCKWNNTKGVPCITITKTPNSSKYNSQGINKIISDPDFTACIITIIFTKSYYIIIIY